ncbi:MAG: protein-arginine kinase [Saprospiraceae bacterium]|jgi:protein-arginine kinase
MTVFADVSKLSTDEFQRTVGVSLDIFHSICTTVSDIIAKEREEKPKLKKEKKNQCESKVNKLELALKIKS